jgi:tRNA(Ile)-lysidine synthetase-like protein
MQAALKKKRWLVAVSGGPDSMALLSMCVRAGMDVGAAHVNYRKRPQANMEEKAVKAWCRRHRVPCYVLDRPYEYEGIFRPSPCLPLPLLRKTAKAHAFDGVLVAHQQDDLIETYLMQKHQNITPARYGLKRTVFMDGLRVVRPLLNKTKAGLEAYCRREGVPYYIDSSNLSDAYARNRVRHHEVQDMDASARRKLLQEIAAANRLLQGRRRQASGLIRRRKAAAGLLPESGQGDPAVRAAAVSGA